MLKETMRFYNPITMQEWAFIEDEDSFFLLGLRDNFEVYQRECPFEDEIMDILEDEIGENGEIIEMINPKDALAYIKDLDIEYPNTIKAIKNYIKDYENTLELIEKGEY